MKIDPPSLGSWSRFVSNESTLRFLARMAVALLLASAAFAQNVISTIAGGGNPVPGNAAATASLETPSARGRG